MLQRRAAAVLRGDEAAFIATVAGAPSDFTSRQRTWFRRMRTLPIGAYRLDMGQDEFSELTRASDREHHSGEVHIVQVKERIGFLGYDVSPSAEDVFYTVVKGPKGWSVVADDDAESLALQSNRNLWDFGDVSHIERGGVMVLFHASERAAAPKLLSMALQAAAHVRGSWPNQWRENKIVLLIPSTVAELARILQTTFDLSTFVAFQASSVDRSSGWALTGARVYLHWPNFRRYAASFQQSILQHEFLHYATHEIDGPFVTSIIDEGVAQYYGEGQYSPSTPQLRGRVRAHQFDGHLVPDYFFTVGPPADIYLAYEEAVHFMSYLGRRFGRGAGSKLYLTLGAERPVLPGTWRYHLDRACRIAFGVSFPALERDWARAVIKELS